jgi:hypothetical protein
MGHTNNVTEREFRSEGRTSGNFLTNNIGRSHSTRAKLPISIFFNWLERGTCLAMSLREIMFAVAA